MTGILTDGRPVIAPSEFPQGQKGPMPVESDVGFFDAIAGPSWNRQNIINNTFFTRDIATYDVVAPSERVDVWGQIAGTPYEDHFDSFAPLQTAAEVNAMKAKIDGEEDDRRIVDEAGAGGVAADMIAMFFDLPTLIPGGVALSGARTGLGVLRVGVRTGLAAGAEAAATEGILQLRQETRTGAESAFAIGGSVILGGLLGTGLSAALARTGAGEAAFQQTAKVLEDHLTRGQPNGFAHPESVGAAARIAPEITDFDLPTRAAQALKDNTPAGLSFTDRFANARSPRARLIGSQLIGNEYAFAGQERLGLEPAAEVFAGVTEDRMRISVARTFRDEYKAHRKAAREAGAVSLRKEEFDARVAAALRRGDVDSTYPEVQRAAERLRREVIDPLRDQAIRMRLLPEGVTPQTATSYFTRMWDANRIVARSDEFLRRMTEKFSGDMRRGGVFTEGAAQQRASALQTELRNLTDADLETPQMASVRGFLSEEGKIKTRLAELRRETKGIGKRPLGQIVRSAGGIDPSGSAAAELRSLGVTPKNSPGLFKRGGLKDVDNIDANLAGTLADEVGVDRAFLSRQGVLDTLAEEARGSPRLGARERALVDEITNLEELIAEGRRLIDETAPDARAARQRVKELRDKVLRAEEKLAEARVRADFSDDELSTFARAAAEDVYRTLTDPTASPTAHLNITIKAQGPLKERTLNVRDVDWEDFLINDAEIVLNRYARVMSAETELTRKFGRADMKDQIAEINDDYARLRDEATTEKERVAIEKERRKVITALEAARDQVRGTYLARERAGTAYRTMQTITTFNYVRALGDVVRSSLTDVFKLSMVNGMMPLVREALVPMISSVTRQPLKVARREIADAAGIAEVELGTRMMRIADITDPYARQTPVEAVMHMMGNKASLFSGILHWNQWLKETAGQLATNRLRRVNLANPSAVDQRFLGRVKLTRANLERIQGQMAEHGQDINGVFVPNIERWDPEVQRLYGAVIRADADTVIVTPGIGDKVPGIEQHWMAKPALQFKAFALASHRKTLLVGLQEDQARFASNAALMVSMGMFVYWLKAQSRENQRLSDNPGVWLAEGIDRSGLVPVVMEINNMAERVGAPGVYYGLGSIFGDSPERASRFQVRNQAGALLGPTGDLLGNVFSLARAGFTGEFGPGEATAGRRLIPFGNHPGIKEFLNLWVMPEIRDELR